MGYAEVAPLSPSHSNGAAGRSRGVLAMLGFFGFFNVYAMRVNLSVAVISMKDDLGWTKTQQGLVLGSFFYGYICTQVLGGQLATLYGGKWVYGLGVLCTSLLTLVTPLAAPHFELFIAVRILEGIGEGVTYPAMHAIWAKWAPPLERSKLSTMCYAGSYMGTIVSLPISGILCKGDFLGGWPAVFYLCGAVGVLWFLVWIALAHNSPADCPYISDAERRYIENSLESERAADQQEGDREENRPLLKQPQGAAVHAPTPWGAIFTSMPVWAIIVAHTTSNWGFYNLLTCMPSFMDNVLGFDVKGAAILSCLPYICMFIVTLAVGRLSDMALVRGLITPTYLRKFNQGFGQVVAGSCLMGMSIVTSDAMAVTLLCGAVGAAGFTLSGFNVNHLEIAPHYAGLLMGISNTVATIPGFLAPQLTDYIAHQQISEFCSHIDPHNHNHNHNQTLPVGPSNFSNHSNIPSNNTLPGQIEICASQRAALQHQWKSVFYIAAGVYLFGTLFYTKFSTSVKQPWATPRAATQKEPRQSQSGTALASDIQ